MLVNVSLLKILHINVWLICYAEYCEAAFTDHILCEWHFVLLFLDCLLLIASIVLLAFCWNIVGLPFLSSSIYNCFELQSLIISSLLLVGWYHGDIGIGSCPMWLLLIKQMTLGLAFDFLGKICKMAYSMFQANFGAFSIFRIHVMVWHRMMTWFIIWEFIILVSCMVCHWMYISDGASIIGTSLQFYVMPFVQGMVALTGFSVCYLFEIGLCWV